MIWRHHRGISPDRAHAVAKAIVGIVTTTAPADQRFHIEQYLRDEFEDHEREIELKIIEAIEEDDES